ncbi:hypothetical protein [Paenibacillus athensensis]|uniref:hypothetical protein n=1 Tax=Paenibacillus athensensis TaxID=1967502 RepID=UPI00106F1480|nr:hypothetical protein [Paenibacillus athensensis]
MNVRINRRLLRLALPGAAAGSAAALLALCMFTTPAAARQETLPAASTQVLQTEAADVTGDGRKDHITLIGEKGEDPGSPYFTQLRLVVAPGDGQAPISLAMEGGYNPRLTLCDMDGDKLPELYVSADTGGSGGFVDHYLYSLRGGVAATLPLPEPLQAEAAFKNSYKVKLKLKETGKVYTISLKDKKADYDQFGVYRNGKLLKPFIVGVNDFGRLEPVDADGDGVCELEGVQRITGIANADTIAYITSVWKWRNHAWTPVQAAIRKTL